MLFFCASNKKGKSQGTPGLNIIKCCFKTISSGFLPAYIVMPFFSISETSPNCSIVFKSCNVTNAPFFASSSAAAIPLLAIPHTRTFFPLYSNENPSFYTANKYRQPKNAIKQSNVVIT